MKHFWVWITLLWSSASAAGTLTVNAFNLDTTAPILSKLETQKVDKIYQKVAKADLHLLLQNRSPKAETVSVEFAVGAGATALVPEVETSRCTSGWGFWITPSVPVNLPVGALQDVQVTFCAPWDSKLAPLTGQLQAHTPTRSLYTQTLTISPPPPTDLIRADKFGFEQSNLVVTTVRFHPLDEVSIWRETTGTQVVGWHGKALLQNLLPVRGSYLYNSAGSRATMSLSSDPARPDEALLTVGELHAGTYTGSWVLRPNDENSPVLTITANVKHHWFWPLMVLLVTCWLAYLGLRWREYDRPKKALQLRLVTAAEEYRKERRKYIGSQYFLPLSFDYDQETNREDPDSEIIKLFKTIDEAQNLSMLTNISAEVASLESLWLRWLPLHQRQASLRAQQAKIRSALNGIPELIKDSAGTRHDPENFYPFLSQVNFSPDDSSNSAIVDAFEVKLGDRTVALQIFGEALATYLQFDQFSINKTQAIVVFRQLTTEDHEVLRALVAQLRTLLATAPADHRALAGDHSYAPAELVDKTNVRVDILAFSALPVPEPTKSSAAYLQRLIDGRDRWVFLALLVVALTATFVAQYGGKNFGTFFDYLTLITSGVTGIALFKGLDLLPVWQLKG